MSDIQSICISFLCIILAVFNLVGWVQVFLEDRNRKALLRILIPLDVVIVVILMLGAFGVLG